MKYGGGGTGKINQKKILGRSDGDATKICLVEVA